MSPAATIGGPLILLAICGVLLVDDVHFKAYILMGVVPILSLLYIFQPQINWWWYNKYEPPIDPQMHKILLRFIPYFSQLSPENQRRFHTRLTLFMLDKEFEGKAIETVTEDIKGFICSMGVIVTFGLEEEFTLTKFERIFVYPHRFPSPKNKELHNSEIETVDGCMIFSRPAVVNALTKTAIHYNVVLHEMGMALKFTKGWDNKDFPFLSEDSIYELLEPIRGFNYPNLLKHTGATSLDPFGIAIEHFFTEPARFKKMIPSLYGALERALNQDPTNSFGPVLGSISIKQKK